MHIQYTLLRELHTSETDEELKAYIEEVVQVGGHSSVSALSLL